MEYKQRILAEYEQLDRAGKGALLRREGLYNQLISHWRRQRDGCAADALQRPVGRPRCDPRDRRIAGLEAEAAKLAAELDRLRAVVGGSRESSPRCWISSPPAARPPAGASHDDYPRHRRRDEGRRGGRRGGGCGPGQ